MYMLFIHLFMYISSYYPFFQRYPKAQLPAIIATSLMAPADSSLIPCP